MFCTRARADDAKIVRSRNAQCKTGESPNIVMKKLFATTMELNVCLHLSYIRTNENPADEPSRRLSSMDCQLTEDVADYRKGVWWSGGSYI